ncbi:MAG: hypothetical protein HYU75_09795 [Betaproteobacteria bacterium]|nr:hypothetical protein [Betaproteobacteria bacterium]
MNRLRFFDLPLRTAYAQAKELALAQSQVPLLTAGSVRIEQRAGSEFAYRYRYDAAGKRITEYLGAMSDPATTGRIEQAGQEIKDVEAIAQYSRQLRKIGFYSADNSTFVTVASLFNAGIFGGGASLVGTHAFGAILNELGASASPFPLTEDVDLVRARRIELAALPEGGFLDLLRRTGLPFHEVPMLKRGAPSTSFKVRGRKLKVDLLVPTKGMPYRPVPIAELGTHAMGLPYMEYLVKASIPSVLIGRDRIVPITVPHPGWFCLHKLALFSLRSGADNPKREKDAFQAALIAAALVREQDFALTEAIDGMDKTLRARIKPGAKRALKYLASEYPEAAQMLETLA